MLDIIDRIKALPSIIKDETGDECISREEVLSILAAQPVPNAGEVFAGQDGGTIAELIANSLGAAEMLSGPVRDAVPVIKKALAASAPSWEG